MTISNIRVAALALVAGFSLVVAGPSKHTAAKDRSTLTYVLIHPLHRIEGTSKDVECEIEYDDATHTIIQASFSTGVDSFDSGNSNRDSHALEILEALMYPTVSFQSTAIVAHGSDLEVKGDLTFHGQTKPISFSASATGSENILNVDGSAKVSLTAFKIERPSLLMIPVEDTLSISFKMVFPLTK